MSVGWFVGCLLFCTVVALVFLVVIWRCCVGCDSELGLALYIRGCVFWLTFDGLRYGWGDLKMVFSMWYVMVIRWRINVIVHVMHPGVYSLNE